MTWSLPRPCQQVSQVPRRRLAHPAHQTSSADHVIRACENAAVRGGHVDNWIPREPLTHREMETVRERRGVAGASEVNANSGYTYPTTRGFEGGLDTVARG